jgi:gamma-glutamyltranspeptidase/glutathione hydrolase
MRILEDGGNAVDAAVATALALTAAEPSGSGLGGQTWMVVRMATGKEVALFCPSRVPTRVDPAAQKAARRGPDLCGPMAAAIPTTLATLDHALRRYGSKSFAEVVAPAIEVADRGYRLRAWERGSVLDYVNRLVQSKILGDVYLMGPSRLAGALEPVPTGSLVKIPGLAETLRRLSAAGPADFYTGEVARKIEEAMKASGGFLRRTDLARVPMQVVETEPARGAYRDLAVLSVPPPAGGSLLARTLYILDAIPAPRLAAVGPGRGQAIVEAVRLARADLAAGELVPGSTSGPFASESAVRAWAAVQAGRIVPGRALSPAELHEGGSRPTAGPATTHVSVVDAEGNAVSLTQSLGRYFGAAWVVPGLGILMNAFLEPFRSDDPKSPGFLRPGAVLPTPVAPALFVRDDRVVLVAGTGGSSRITSILANVLVDHVDGRHPIDSALATPRVLWEDEGAGGRVMLELAPPLEPRHVSALKEMGYGNVFVLSAPGKDSGAFGGVNAAAWDPSTSTWEGVADSRRNGAAAAAGRSSSGAE